MKFSAATWKTNSSYFDALKLLASFSGLFSDNEIPYLDYRLAENAFCRFFEAENEARSCTAYDACTNAIGIGIKTFTLKNNQSTEKIAEFNKASRIVVGKNMAYQKSHTKTLRIQDTKTLRFKKTLRRINREDFKTVDN